MHKVEFQAALRHICALYHQRGLERSWTELKKFIRDYRKRFPSHSVQQAIEYLEADAEGRNP